MPDNDLRLWAVTAERKCNLPEHDIIGQAARNESWIGGSKGRLGSHPEGKGEIPGKKREKGGGANSLPNDVSNRQPDGVRPRTNKTKPSHGRVSPPSSIYMCETKRNAQDLKPWSSWKLAQPPQNGSESRDEVI